MWFVKRYRFKNILNGCAYYSLPSRAQVAETTFTDVSIRISEGILRGLHRAVY